MSEKDNIYRDRDGDPGSFRFDDRVADVFPDMIHRSVPGYDLIVPMIGQLAQRYAQPGTVVMDLGCSLGAAALSMRRALAGSDVEIIAVDSSEPMVRRCRERVAADGRGVPVRVLREDVRAVDVSRASVVVLNFTLQFIDQAERLPLLRRIAAGLEPGGVLILSEKLRLEDEEEQRRQTDWHHDYKRLQGYSELEIARKRNALERVLIPETEAAHRARLLEAGFDRVDRWFQCFAFCSLLAQKQ